MPNITYDILNGNLNDEYYNLIDAIKKSPKNTDHMIVYRGLSINIDTKIGDIYYHKTPLWTTFHETYAKKFQKNTKQCYTIPNSFFMNDNSTKSGNLLKIYIPPGSNYLERILCIEFNSLQSEIIFGPSKLYIDNIYNNIIETTLIIDE